MTSKQVTSPPWNSRRLVHSKEMAWASRWSVALRAFYRQILSSSNCKDFFFKWHRPPRKLAKEVFVKFIPAKEKTRFAKEWRKVLAKDHVIRIDSHEVFNTAQMLSRIEMASMRCRNRFHNHMSQLANSIVGQDEGVFTQVLQPSFCKLHLANQIQGYHWTFATGHEEMSDRGSGKHLTFEHLRPAETWQQIANSVTLRHDWTRLSLPSDSNRCTIHKVRSFQNPSWHKSPKTF